MIFGAAYDEALGDQLGVTVKAAARIDALASNGMDEIEIPAFLRKQAD